MKDNQQAEITKQVEIRQQAEIRQQKKKENAHK
jgi:hypothetical protein